MNKTKSQVVKHQIGKSRDRLFRVALAWSGDEILADILVQEAMTEGIKSSHQLLDENRLFVWLFSILNNVWCEYLRTEKPQTKQDEQLVEDVCDVPRYSDDKEMVHRVRRAVATLPYDQRQIIALVDLEELTYGEVSEVLGMPIGAVMSRLRWARKNLIMILEKPFPRVGVIHRKDKSKDEIRKTK